MHNEPANQDALKKAQAIQKQHGTSYYLATQFFPKHFRQATYALYSFVRIPDQIVDEPGKDPLQAKEELERWIAAWRGEMEGKASGDSLIKLSTELFTTYNVPRTYGEDFLAAMLQDTTQDRYESYAALEQYMYGSAVVVGLMMAHIVGAVAGADSEKVLKAATCLGNAMQLTNFLRDIDEDYQDRGRIYLPQDEMGRYGVKEHDIASRVMSENLKRLMRFQVERARNLFAAAEPGILLLNPKARRAVRLAGKLYASILDSIVKQDYNPFAGRARVSRSKKVKIILKHYWR
ncbi:phytoene/squalene synthase family protein [soil metagenome]